jgi:Lipid A 3-O-deacylase (PagL)
MGSWISPSHSPTPTGPFRYRGVGLSCGEQGAKFFFGLGGAYKTETDELNGSHLNFAEQLGVRFTRCAAGAGFELALRHMSNAGLKRPNKGQDFVTVIYVF